MLPLRCTRFFLLALLVIASVAAQTLSTLHGTITDESGALVPGAKVTVTGPGGAAKATVSGNDGTYSINGLTPGKYNVQASASGLKQFQPLNADISASSVTADIQLRVVLENQEVTVQETTTPMVSTDPASNAGALVLRGEDLQALSDDPDDLQADLQALAGPAAGPNGGQIYIDGFTGGQLPSKDSIREIRINQNPFSPEYDKLGFGRIEILTKPGTDKFRGSAYFNYGTDVLNSRNPYATQKAPFGLKEFGGNLSGPINKRASFFLDVDNRYIDNSAIIDAVTLNPTSLAVDPYSSVLLTPYRRLRISPRLDYQINQNNTLTVRYGYTRNQQDNGGVGGFSLPSRGVNSLTTDHTVQATETAVLSAKAVNETRFQFFGTDLTQNAVNSTPSLNVQSSFSGGGAQIGHSEDTQSHYEIQNYTTLTSGVHVFKFGVRLRAETLTDRSPSNFGGSFSFNGGYAPVLDPATNLPVDPTLTCAAQLQSAGCQTITSIERYRRTLLYQQMGLSPSLIQQYGGGASQFSINTGNPISQVGQVDTGLYVGDDWRIRPNITLSLGLRWETQTNIADKSDWAPRLAFAWAPGSSSKGRPKTVVRGGFGMFYDRFSENNVLTAERYNGVTQQSYIVTNPTFYPLIPSIATLAGSAAQQTIHEISSQLHAPYIIQSAIGIERQIPGNTTVAVTYTNSHGVHELRSRDINPPAPGTYKGPGTGVFPYGTTDPIFVYVSDGIYNQNQLISNINSRLNKNVSLFGFYMLNFAKSTADGVGTFPGSPYNDNGEYGPAATDVRHRVFIGGSIATYWNLRLSPFITAQTGAPFDITTGQDVYGTTLFTSRPGIATDTSKAGLISTPYGLLDPNPTPGETILGRNVGRGPGQFTVNMRLAKTFGFGPAREGAGGFGGGGGGDHGPGGGGHGGGPGGGPGGMRMGGGPMGGGGGTNKRYNLTVSISARNLFNHVNPGPVIGTVTSPLFGQSNSIAGGFGAFSENANNRRIELQARFTF